MGCTDSRINVVKGSDGSPVYGITPSVTMSGRSDRRVGVGRSCKPPRYLLRDVEENGVPGNDSDKEDSLYDKGNERKERKGGVTVVKGDPLYMYEDRSRWGEVDRLPMSGGSSGNSSGKELLRKVLTVPTLSRVGRNVKENVCKESEKTLTDQGPR